MARERFPIASSQAGTHAGHRRQEVFDHPVGVGVVGIEAIDLAFGGEVDSGLTLDIEDDARRIDSRLLTGQSNEPVGNRVRTDRRSSNVGYRWNSFSIREAGVGSPEF